MVHMHRTLGDGVERIVSPFSLRGRIEKRQRIKVGCNPGAVTVRRLNCTMAHRREAELLQRFEIQLKDDRIGCADKPDVTRPFQVRLISVFIEALLIFQVMLIERPVGDVLLQLFRIRRAFAEGFAVDATEPGQRANAGRAFVVDNII